MGGDELRAAPVDDTIAQLVRAAGRAGFDIESDAPDEVAVEAGPRRNAWRHVRAIVVAFVAVLAAGISFASSSGGKVAIVVTILVLMCASLADIYGRTSSPPR